MSSASSVVPNNIPMASRGAENDVVWPKGVRAKLFGLTAACIIGAVVVFMGIVGAILAVA